MEMEASNLIMAERSPVASPGGISSKLGGKTLNNAISISVTVADTKEMSDVTSAAGANWPSPGSVRSTRSRPMVSSRRTDEGARSATSASPTRSNRRAVSSRAEGARVAPASASKFYRPVDALCSIETTIWLSAGGPIPRRTVPSTPRTSSPGPKASPTWISMTESGLLTTGPGASAKTAKLVAAVAPRVRGHAVSSDAPGADVTAFGAGADAAAARVATRGGAAAVVAVGARRSGRSALLGMLQPAARLPGAAPTSPAQPAALSAGLLARAATELFARKPANATVSVRAAAATAGGRGVLRDVLVPASRALLARTWAGTEEQPMSSVAAVLAAAARAAAAAASADGLPPEALVFSVLVRRQGELEAYGALHFVEAGVRPITPAAPWRRSPTKGTRIAATASRGEAVKTAKGASDAEAAAVAAEGKDAEVVAAVVTHVEAAAATTEVAPTDAAEAVVRSLKARPGEGARLAAIEPLAPPVALLYEVLEPCREAAVYGCVAVAGLEDAGADTLRCMRALLPERHLTAEELVDESEGAQPRPAHVLEGLRSELLRWGADGPEADPTELAVILAGQNDMWKLMDKVRARTGGIDDDAVVSGDDAAGPVSGGAADGAEPEADAALAPVTDKHEAAGLSPAAAFARACELGGRLPDEIAGDDKDFRRPARARPGADSPNFFAKLFGCFSANAAA